MESDKLNNPFGDILSQYSSNFSSLKSSSSGFDFGDLLNSIAKDSKPNDDESSSEQNQSYTVHIQGKEHSWNIYQGR